VDFGGGPLAAAGLSDIFIAQYDANGVHQWSRRYGDTEGALGWDIDYGWDVAVDDSGNVIATGDFLGTVDFGGGPLVSAGDSPDIFLAKYGLPPITDPIELLQDLVEHVRSLDLHHGTENSLLSRLDAALMTLTDLVEGNDHAAVNILGAFINQVEAQRGKKIAEDDADELIAAAQEIIDLTA